MAPGLEPSRYATWFRSELGQRVWRDELTALDRVMGDVARHTVLDAGAGDGRLAREMASCGAHVVALDRSAAMLCAAGSAAIEARHDAERRRWRQRRERLEYEAARAERQYEACEPENRRVARTAELGTAVAEAVRNA